MNKTQLVAKFASLASIPDSRADFYLAALLDAMESGLRHDGRVAIKDFGTFERRVRSGRSYRVPGTEQIVTSPPREKVTFRPSPALRARIGCAPAVQHESEVKV